MPQPRTGRRHAPLSDMIFACAFKVYSTMSSRRFAKANKSRMDGWSIQNHFPVKGAERDKVDGTPEVYV